MKKNILVLITICISFFSFMQVTVAASETIIIDVRSDEEFNAGHLQGALHMPYQEIGELISDKVKDKNAEIILYCRSGGRADKAKKTLIELGYTLVENGGGLDGMKKRFPDK